MFDAKQFIYKKSTLIIKISYEFNGKWIIILVEDSNIRFYFFSLVIIFGVIISLLFVSGVVLELLLHYMFNYFLKTKKSTIYSFIYIVIVLVLTHSDSVFADARKRSFLSMNIVKRLKAKTLQQDRR